MPTSPLEQGVPQLRPGRLHAGPALLPQTPAGSLLKGLEVVLEEPPERGKLDGAGEQGGRAPTGHHVADGGLGAAVVLVDAAVALGGGAAESVQRLHLFRELPQIPRRFLVPRKES